MKNNKMPCMQGWALWLVFALLPPVAMAQSTKNTYTLEGKTSKWASFTLQYMVDDRRIENTAEVKNGMFKITGDINTGTQASLMMRPADLSNSGSAGGVRIMTSIVHLWLEPGHIQVSNLDSVGKIKFSGSPLNDDQNELYSEESALTKLPVGPQQDEERKLIVTKFIKAHPASMVSFTELEYVLSRGVPDLNIVEPLFNGLSAVIKNSPEGKAYQKKIENWKLVDVGSVAPDFTQPNQNGKPVKLSDFKGKYVLIDFWASWCHPCRDENPNLIRQFNLYKDKGFVILSVSLDGGQADSKKRWLDAIKQDQVGIWPQVCDFAGDSKKNIARLKYGVGSIPENFLVDPDGKIIGKSLLGEKLNKKLTEIFSAPSVSHPANSPAGATIAPAVSGKVIGTPLAPTIADDEVLPLDAAVRNGKLPNGFTYYIRHNTLPKNRVTFYLANKVGSILENEDQRGLAHFMEHMNFDGTTHFPKYELINYLQKSGVRFGADLNAYTSFDETVYQLPLPSDDPAVLKNGIQIMRDWAKGALLDSKEINRERGVVLEEKRIGKGAGERMNRKYLPILLNGSRYAERLPIGIDTVLNNFKPETLRDFYRDWYRPDLQALIVVGDIDVDQMEKTIKAQFADLSNPANERERKKYTVPLTGKNQFAVITDAEQSSTVMQVIIKHQEDELKTPADYRKAIIKQLFNKMLAERISDLTTNKSNPPFIRGSAGTGGILGGLDAFSTMCIANNGELEKGFKAIWREIARIKRFGFTQTELDRAKSTVLMRRETALADVKSTGSEVFVTEYLQHFLKDIAAPGLASEFEMAKAYLPGITLGSMQKLATEYIRDDNRDIILMASDKDKLSLPDEQKIEQWMTDVVKEEITPYQDSFNQGKLYSKEPTPGKIIKENKITSIDATEWTLSNGARVILKKTDFSGSSILVGAFAPGGSSVYNDHDFESARDAPFISFMSGVGNYSYGDFSKLVNGKDMFTTNASIENYVTRLQGGASLKEMETYLQILYTQFTEPRFDQESFKGFIANQKALIANKSRDPKNIFTDTVQSIVNNNSIRMAGYTLSTLAEIDLANCQKIYNQLITGDVSNFTFIFSGPIDLDKLRPLIERYLASLPAASNHLPVKNLQIHPPATKLNKTVYLGTEPKSSVNLVFSGTYSYNPENNKTLEALKEVIQINLLKRLREQESGAYSPYAVVSFEKTPEQRFRFKIAFDCAPENADKLVASALDEVNKIKMNGPDMESLEKFKAEDRRGHELKLKEDFWWITYIQQQILNHDDFNELNNYDQVLQKLTTEDVKKAANQYLSDDRLIKLVLKPELPKP